MRHNENIHKWFCTVLYFAAAFGAIAAYDPTWTKSQCNTYSYNGLKERYVYGGNKGWINNNAFDDATIEGVDCASYVSRCLALPEYVAEDKAASYPYTTTKLIVGVPNTVEVASVNDLQQWDLWVYVTSSSKHTGLFKQYSGSYIITREARSATSGVVEGKFSKQSLIDRGTRYWRRANWASAPVAPTVQTKAATGILYSSATLNATITSTGNAVIDEAGFAWGRTTSCSDGWVDGQLSGENFNCTLSGLMPSTTYYFKAQAHNSIGWGTGTTLSFTTSQEPVSGTFIIDNGQTGTSWTGTWGISGGTGCYGTNSLWARDGAAYTWSFNPWPAGVYEVSMWWTEYASRGTAIPVQVNHADGTAYLTVNQQIGGQQWNSLGQYYFDTAGSVTLIADGSYPTSHCADAVKFTLLNSNEAPIAQIVSITPKSSQTGEYVAFTGQGTDDGGIEAYEWSSSINGVFAASPSVALSTLSAGTHIISFRVCDNQGAWSAAAQDTITVVNPSFEEIIIDNGGAGTSYKGTWAASGGTNPYGTNSLWARVATSYYTWSFTPTQDGSYEVYMWWTEFSSRGTAIPVAVTHSLGTADLAVDQQANGGQWNSLGTYRFNAGQTFSVKLFTAGDDSTTCADAVRVVRVSD